MNDREAANAKVVQFRAKVAVLDQGDHHRQVELTGWQQSILEQREDDLKSGVAWHPAVLATENVVTQVQTPDTLRAEVQREVASWFVQANGKFIKLGSGPMQYSAWDMEKLLPQMPNRSGSTSGRSPSQVSAAR